MSRPPRQRQTTMQPERRSIRWHDPNETASGKPGTLQTGAGRLSRCIKSIISAAARMPSEWQISLRR
jgi:hypothetical protein